MPVLSLRGRFCLHELAIWLHACCCHALQNVLCIHNGTELAFHVTGQLSPLKPHATLSVDTGQGWQQDARRTQIEAACAQGRSDCLHHSRLLGQKVHL